MKAADVTTQPVEVALAMSSCALTTAQEISQAIAIAVLSLFGGAHGGPESIP